MLWALSILSLMGIWYSSEVHLYLSNNVSFYSIKSAALIQVVLAVLAGVFATKAADSSRELRKLFKVKDIQELLQKADDAAAKSMEEANRLKNIVKLVGYEVEQQFARDMLINHRKQLSFHWEQILKLEAVFKKEDTSKGLDPEVKKLIQNYIIKTQYLEYMGKGFLRNIPILGGLFDYLFGPLWNAYYLKNLPRFNKIAKKQKASNNDIKQ
ncbi:MAG: hypothetical protein QG657_5166 [Acidobacteriota bacterium]|nr:hypothetical protein [Acidobacteriota bacterium]